MLLPGFVKLVEVGPRDGLQNEKKIISTENKIEFVDRLSQTGLKVIEVTSFVSRKKIPQLIDATQVLQGIKLKKGVRYPVLVPNLLGFENALHAGAHEIAVFASATETFSKKNINCSISESLKHFEEVILQAKKLRIPVRAYISCAFVCPYEGKVNSRAVISMAEKLFQLGCYEISIGDTLGMATPLQVKYLFNALGKIIPSAQLAGHFHDSYGQALANIFSALQEGIAIFDASVSGLGGCPYAVGATGNVATEDVLYMLNGLGIKTGVNLKALIQAGNYICDYLGRKTNSKVSLAMSD